MKIDRDEFIEMVVAKVNRKINIPFLSERVEAIIFRNIIVSVIEVIDAMFEEKLTG